MAADSPPQLPVIPNTPTLSSSIGNSPTIPGEYSAETSPDFDLARLNAGGSTPVGQSPASANRFVPSTSSDKQSHSQSSPAGRENPGETCSTSYADLSPVSLTAARLDQGSESSKLSSPHPSASGKGPSTAELQLSNTQNRSGASGMASGGHSRFRSFPNESPVDKPGASQRDYNHKYDVTSSNPVRSTEREIPTEVPHHKSGKARLHLLNPMLLLAKRRSSRAAGSKTGDGKKLGARNNIVPAIPEDFDPRIRGNIVHDFSAPRPRRNVSGQPDETGQSSAHARSQSGFVTLGDRDDRASQPVEQRRHSEHSPAFREHFDHDAQKSLQAENKAYLQSRLLDTQDHGHEVPEFAKRLPSRVDRDDTPAQRSECPPAQRDGKTAEGQSQEGDKGEKPQSSTGLPKRLKSNSSRFSFDMNAVESSDQEKLLEEKHKEKEATRRAKAQFDDRDFSDVDDDYDDVLDDDGGLEEQIPGVNVDADADELESVPGTGLADKSWLAPGLSPVVASPISPAGPKMPTVSTSGADNDPGLDPGIHEEPSLGPSHSPSVYDDFAPSDEARIQQQANESIPGVDTHVEPAVSQPKQTLEDDELYFDDGEFGDLVAEAEGETFDESIFDDDTSHLFDLKVKAEPTQEQDSGGVVFEGDEAIEQPADQELKHVPSMASDFLSIPGDHRRSSERIPTMGTIKSRGGVLTEHNLEALHNALAKAADELATKIDRNPSLSERSTDQGSIARTVDSHPGLVSDDSRLSQVIWGVDEAFEDFSHEDNDATYDDPIIAAANAEALENDDEGFYGQEFGFYAYTHGNSGSQLTNGGYFGPRGIEGIPRSHSSRAKFEEPSLTPITERSEWSTRNSVISLGAAHGAAHSNATTSLSNPGLAQLVGMGNIDDEMSLSALLKLRRDAFGGSNGSLQSSSSSSPLHAAYPASKRGSQAGLSDVSPISPTGLDAGTAEWPISPDRIYTEDASRVDV